VLFALWEFLRYTLDLGRIELRSLSILIFLQPSEARIFRASLSSQKLTLFETAGPRLRRLIFCSIRLSDNHCSFPYQSTGDRMSCFMRRRLSQTGADLLR
jgi:hypothetical protein